ncbi:hypothetical protein BKA57DRAFT_60744 [Linnemannia elongata]|nr:hypothetical protein BKA57DRAFT_60744 [Linnemannia elongata]
MPFLSRVLHPASKRKPPIRSQGSTSQSQCLSISTTTATTAKARPTIHPTIEPLAGRSRRPGCTRASNQRHSDTHGSTSSSSSLSSHSHQSPTTISDLYPVFRFILESRSTTRYHRPQQSYQGRIQSTSTSASPTCRSNQSGIYATTSDSSRVHSYSGSWRGGGNQSVPKRFYSSSRAEPTRLNTFSSNGQAASTSQHSFPSSVSTGSRTLHSSSHSGFGSTRNTRDAIATIPSRSISQQHSAKALVDIPDLRIPEEFLPLDSIQRAPLQPPTPLIVKDWMLSQISHARDLFQKQNYMQALVVVEKAKEHDYIRSLSTFPPSTASSLVARWHYQDLCLVEYCCRLLCAHEAQIGNIDIVDTLQRLNTSILDPVGKFKTRSKISFKSTFQLHQDPLLDYTLAIIAKNWNELLALSPASTSQTASPDQEAVASAVYPFLQAISSRRLFPSTTTIFQDVTAAPTLVSSSRRVALDVFVALGDHKGAMQWIWLWERLDRQDWLCQWSQLEFKQGLSSHFQRSGRPDWILDLFRLSNKASGTPELWVQDLLDTFPSRHSSGLATAGDTLSHVLYQASMDLGASSSKKQYYQMDSWKRLDLTESWLAGIQGAAVFNPYDSRTVEEELWREMAMVGVLSEDLCLQDVMRSVHPDVLAVIQPSHSPLQERPKDVHQASSNSGGYHDALTAHLEEMASKASRTAHCQSGNASSKQSTKVFTALQRAIQETMSTASVQDTLGAYRSLLHNVAHHFALRSRHLGLISQVIEIEFRSLKGNDVWKQTKLAAGRSHAAVRRSQSPSPPQQGYGLSAIADVRGFADGYLRSDLAMMCAVSTMSAAGSISNKWTGQLSDWFMAVAESSGHTGPLARSLQCQGQLLPGSEAYNKAMWVLLQDHEYDVAVALHCHVYLQDGTKNVSERIARPPSTEEVRKLVHALVMSDEPKHLDKAHWIVERHLDKAQSMSVDAVNQPSSVDLDILTELAGAWSRHAEFDRVRQVVDIMKEHDISHNMTFYNTLLKSLVDLAPLSRPGKRTMGSGKQSGMRELGREIMVRQLLKSRQHDRGRQKGESLQTDLDKGWNVFLSAVSGDSAGRVSLSGQGMDSPLMLKNFITHSSSSSRRLEGSLFRPDGHTFSILLGAFAKRGEIESISELFVEMKQVGLEPDVVICNILANAFAKRGDLKSVDRVLQEARNRNMEPGLYLTNAVLDSLVETSASASKIRETLSGMVTVAAETESLSSGVDAEIPVRRLDRSQRQRHQIAARDRLARLPGSPSKQSFGGAPLESGLDSVTLTTLIKYHIRQNDLRSAQHVVKAMVEAGMVPDSRAYVLLLSGSIRKGDIPAGLETLRAMRTQSGLYPDAKAWKGLLRCAMELEKPLQSDPQLISRPSAFDGGFQGPDGGNSKDLQHRRPRESHLSLVLQELATVMDEMERTRYSPIRSSDMTGSDDARKQYLSGILTSAWISSPRKDEEEERDDESSRVLSADVKGKNSLLRRLLDHYLQPAVVESGSSSILLSSSSSLPRYSETEEDILERCQHAIRLVRMVESCGIELGPQWKWDVVVRRVRELTGRDASAIAKELTRSTKEMVDGSLEGGLEEFRVRPGPRRRSRSQARMRKA